MDTSLKNLLSAVRIPKSATKVGFCVTCQADARLREIKQAKQLAAESVQPGSKVTYSFTEMDRNREWWHCFDVEPPGEDSYVYQIEARAVVPKEMITAAAFYTVDKKNYTCAAVLFVSTGHLHITKTDRNEVWLNTKNH